VPQVLLELQEVTAGYGPITVLKAVSLEVRSDEIVCLLGGNAAGKTTTMKSIIGTLPLWKGKILFQGTPIHHRATADIVRRGLALVPEGRRIFPRMTVEENLELGSYLRYDKGIDADMARVYGKFPRLKERRKQLGGTLSGGEQQMLAIGRALMSRPKMLLMDEPSMGLAPALVDQVFEIITEIHKEGTSILLVEQNARMALSVAHRGYVIQQGEIVLSGPGDELLRSEEVQHAYLGGA
jgi:branched-chain amino acid transport system ATP-binding protein